jgi:hypothetical protein
MCEMRIETRDLNREGHWPEGSTGPEGAPEHTSGRIAGPAYGQRLAGDPGAEGCQTNADARPPAHAVAHSPWPRTRLPAWVGFVGLRGRSRRVRLPRTLLGLPEFADLESSMAVAQRPLRWERAGGHGGCPLWLCQTDAIAIRSQSKSNPKTEPPIEQQGC